MHTAMKDGAVRGGCRCQFGRPRCSEKVQLQGEGRHVTSPS